MKLSRYLLVLSAFVFVVFALLIQSSEAQRRRQGQGVKGPARESSERLRDRDRPAAAKPLSEKAAAARRARALMQDTSAPTPISREAVNFAESAPLSQIAAQSAAMEDDQPDNEEAEAAENRAVHQVTASAIAKAQLRGSLMEMLKRDGAIQTAAPTANIPAPLTSFEGLGRTENIAAGFGNLSPPDTDGYVGPNHYVQQTNLLVRVWNKSGTPLTPPFRLSTLFAPLGGRCAQPDQGDPIVLYDELADRWILSQFAFIAQNTAPYHQCIAVSKNSDPTGGYYLYDFVTVGNEFPDYPKIGVWPDGYYMMVHQFTLGGPFNGTGAYSFNRAKMLAGDPTANFIYFNLNLASHPEAIGGALPSDFDGGTPPPAGRPNTFAYFTTTDFGDPANGLRLFDFHSDFTNPANSTFTERPESTYAAPLAVAPFSIITPTGNQGRRAVPQPSPAAGVTTALDAIADRLMFRLQYRNRGGFETLVVTHTVGAPATTVFGTFRAGIRYYELRRSLPSGNFVVQEQATYAPADGISRWMGSAAEDNQGNLAVGFTVSSGAAGGNVFPGVRYAGRLATDPSGGLFQGESTIIIGTGVQLSTGNRWGDYSALTVDPSDDCTFWFTNEYYTAAGQAASTVGWQTRIGSFKFDQCTPPPMGTLSGTITYCETGAPVEGAIVEVSDGHSGTTLADGTYSIKLPPGNYTVHTSAGAANCVTSSSTAVAINNGQTTSYNTCLSGTPNLKIASSTISGGNGDTVINLNECNSLTVNLTNPGCAGVTNASAVLSSTTPGVTIEQPNSPLPNIPIGGNVNNTVPFEFSTSPTFVCGTTINFTLTVTSDQGVSVLNFSKPTCQAPVANFAGSIAAGDPTMTGRIVRNGIASVCGVNKAYPGNQDLTPGRRYDTYSFTNTGNATTCVTVNVTSSCSTNIFYVAYLGAFNPANISQNYLADAGSSFAGLATFSFNVPAGQTFTLVIHEVNVNAGCTGYTGTVSGLLVGTDGGGVCETCQITSPSNITVNNDPGECGAIVNFPAATSDGSCGVLTTTPASGSFFPVGTTTVTTTATSGATSSFTVTVNDTESPTLGDPTASPAALRPPNHLMTDVTVNYNATDNCPLNCVLSVSSNEPVNGTGDGDSAPDWEVIDAHHLKLRAERAGTGSGRIYTITVTCSDGSGHVATKSTTVLVLHNAGSKGGGFKANKLGSLLDDLGTKGAVLEALANVDTKADKSFSSAGIYKMPEGIVVIYDDRARFAAGGGWATAAAGSYPANPNLSGRLTFGFNSKYSNSNSPKGSSLVRFELGKFEFRSASYESVSVTNNRGQFRGVGKVNGDAGYSFILTVIDGDRNGETGVDKIRIRIWNSKTGTVVFDNQPGAGESADPTTEIGEGSRIVIKN